MTRLNVRSLRCALLNLIFGAALVFDVVGCGGSKRNSDLGVGVVCLSDPQQECQEGTFCKFAEGDCETSTLHTGVCTEISQICPEYYSPVCGCDHKTYSNTCFADGGGVSVLHQGACGERLEE